MWYGITLFLGLLAGAFCVGIAVMDWARKVREKEKAAELQAKRYKEALEAATAKQRELDQLSANLLKQGRDLEHRIITYSELEAENRTLKRDLQNVDVHLHKLELDTEVQAHRQKELDERSTQLAKRYLTETVKAVVSSIGPSNFTACKDRLLDVIGRCRSIGFDVPADEEARLLADLRKEFEKAVRAAFEREEEARIRAQIREEEKLKREIARELQQLDRERAAIQAALDQALAAAKGEYSAEVARLQQRLAEAEEKSKRAMSMAQQTKAGHVYVISNIGSFGEGVFKVGMTRRLKPEERILELGSASVPFPFDIHAKIHSDDAPALELALHRALHKCRVNKAKPSPARRGETGLTERLPHEILRLPLRLTFRGS
jgi:hypothetical protein